MLKEVGASGQISLGKKYAGQLFDGWLTPERLAARKAALERPPEETARLARQWETENQHVIDSMNRHYEAVGSMGWRMYEWRKKQAAAADAASAEQHRSQRKN